MVKELLLWFLQLATPLRWFQHYLRSTHLLCTVTGCLCGFQPAHIPRGWGGPL